MTHGLALKMQMQLRGLARQHGVPLYTAAHEEPALSECDEYSVSLHGYASDYGVDLERVQFARNALLWHKNHMPELRYRHQPGAVGTINTLEHTPAGLRISCSTKDKRAMVCPAFSIAATITQFTVIGADTPEFFALIHSAWLDEVSLVHAPANPRAVVHERAPGAPHLQMFDLGIRAYQLIAQIIQLEMGARA